MSAYVDDTIGRWWVLHDDTIRELFDGIASGDLSTAEAYALLCEHTTDEHVEPKGDAL